MAKKQKTDFKEKSLEALRSDVKDAKRGLFTVRFDMEMRKDKNTKLFLSKRKEFARMMTALRSAEISAKKEVANG